MLPKKWVLTASALVSILIIVWNYVGNYKICNTIISSGSQGDCPFVLTQVGLTLLPLFTVFIISLITFVMRGEVYEAWFKLARWWVPISMILIFITPEYGEGLFDPIQKGSVALLTSVLFALISIGIIVWKFFSTRKKA